MDSQTDDAVQHWKEHRYRPTDLPFAEVVRSLQGKRPLIEARQSPTRKTDWLLCRSGTSVPATFVYAGVFSESDPYETGNLVWGKHPTPEGLEETRVTRFAGFKAAYSFSIETFHDKEIWELQKILDSYMESVPGFNTRGVKRREWQNGSTWHLRYCLRTPMFLTCESRGGKPEPPEGLHEWVVAAHKKSKSYRANPVRPLMCGLEQGRLEKIEKCVPNKLEYGDVVSIVFTLAYVEDRDDWGPVPTVSHVIRVRHANRDVYQLTSELADVVMYDAGPTLEMGMVVDEQAAGVAVPSDKGKCPEAVEDANSGARGEIHTSQRREMSGASAAVVENSCVRLPSPTLALESADRGGSSSLPTSSATVDETACAKSLGKKNAAGSGSEMDVDDEEIARFARTRTGGGGIGSDGDVSIGSRGSTLTASSSDDDDDLDQRAPKRRKVDLSNEVGDRVHGRSVAGRSHGGLVSHGAKKSSK